MKRSLHKILAIILTLVLVIGQTPAPTLAVTSESFSLNGDIVADAVAGSASQLDFDPYSDYVENEIVLTDADTNEAFPEGHQFSAGDRLRFKVRFELNSSDAWYGNPWRPTDCDYMIREAYRQGNTGYGFIATPTTLPQIDENTVFTIPFEGLQYLTQASSLPWSQSEKQAGYIDGSMNVAFYWWLDRSTNQLCLTFTEEALMGSRGYETLNNMYINVTSTLDMSALAGAGSAEFIVANVPFELPLAASYSAGKKAQMVFNKATGNYDINYTVTVNVDRDVDLSSVDLNILDTRKTGTIIGEPTNVQVTTDSGDDVSVSATKVDDLNTRFDLSSGDNILKKGQYTITYTAPVTQSYDSLFGNGGNGYNALTNDQRQNDVTVRNGDTPTDAKATAQLSWVPAAEETRFDKGTLYDYANQPSYNNIYKETVNGQDCYFVDYYVEARIKNDAGSLVITDDAGQWMTHVNETPEVLYISKGLDEWFNADDMTAASGASVSYTDNGSVRTYTITGDPLAAGAYRIKYRLQVKPEAVAQALASGSALELKNSAAMTTLDEQPVSNRTAQSTNNIPASETPSKTYEVTTAEDGTKLIKWTLRFRWNFFQDDQSRIVDTLSSGEYYIAEGYPFTINNNYNDRASITDPANAANIGVTFNADNTSFTYVLGTCGHADERTDAPYVITYYTRVEANEDGSYPEHSNTYDVTYSSGGATGTTTGTVTAPLTGTEPEEPDPEDPDTPETAIEVAPGKDHISSTYDKATQRVISKWEVTVDLSNLPMERMTSFAITDLIPDNLKNNMAITGVDVVARAADWNTTTPLTKDTHYTVTETSDDEWTVNLQLASALEAIGTSRWITATFTTSSTLIDPNQEYQNYQNNARLDYAYGDFTVSKTDDAWGSCQLLKSKKEASVYSDYYNPATGEYGFGPDGVNDLIWQLVLKDAAFKNRGTPTTVTISDTMPTTDSGIPIMQLMEGSLRIRSTAVTDGNVPVYITNYTLNNSGTGFTLTFDVPADWASDTVYVFYCCEMTSEYMATVQGDTYLNNVTNTATAGWDGTSEQLQATTGLNVPDKRLTKTGAVSSDRSKVTYTIRINEHGLDLDSTGDTVLLTDRMNSTSVSYAQASFVLKDSAGNTLTRSGTASATTYHLKFSDDGKSFELEIPDETSLVLTYIAEPTTQVGSETGNIGNEAKLGTVTRYSNVNSFKVDLPSAGASTALSKGECGVLIYKNDGETDMPLDGAVFTVYSVNPDLTETATSKSATTVGGRALLRFKSDEEGFGFDQVYCIRETTAPEGYQKTDTAWYFYFIALDENGDQVEPNEAVKATVAALEAAGVTVDVDPTVEMYTYTAVNTAITVQTGSFSFTKVDQNGAALEGASFTLVDNLTQQTVEAVSGSAAGVFAYEDLLPGTYTLTEVAAPAGYAKPENASWTVTVAEDGAVTVTGEGYDAAKNTITNTQITGSFSFTKVDQNGAALEGASFTLVDNLTQQTVEAVSGSAAGVFAYENLLPGTYTLTEVTAPVGYAKPENASWTVTVAEDGTVTVTGEGYDAAKNTITNTQITGSFSFTKVDQNGAALDGATFTLVDNLTQQTVEAVSGSAAGVFAYENLLPGTYALTEITAPAGYAKPENASWTVTVAEDGAVTVTGEGYDAAKNTITNTQITGSFSFTKVDQDGVALEGATFTLVDANQQPVTATANTAAGVYTYENLLPGTYTLTETTAPAGYALPANTTWTVTVSETGEVTVTGEGFDTANNTITNTRIEGTFSFTKVDQDGVALEGATFTLVDANQQPVTATTNTAAGVYTYENLLPGIYTLTETAAPAGYALPANTSWTVTVSETGEVTVIGEDFNTANNTITNTRIEGTFSFTKVDQDGVALEGATFTLMDASQQPVTATANTAAGVYTYENLLPGTYTLTETAAPAGYALPANTTWTVTVSETGEVTVTGEDFDTANSTITNTRIEGTFSFTKVDQDGVTLEGATFTLVDANQQPVTATANTAAGVYTYENLLPGAYTLTETAAPAGYALPANTTWTVTVSETGEVTVAGEGFDTANNTITNTRIEGTFSFMKVDQDGAALEGATFTLVDATQQPVTATANTAAGVYTYENLLPGAYTLTETAAPAGYALPANTTWTVTVSETGEVTVTGEGFDTANNTITNTRIEGTFSFTKVDQDGVALEGATFALVDANQQPVAATANTAAGVYTYENLLPGTYTLTETTAPAGYALPSNTTWTVTVSETGEVIVTGEGFDTANNTITNTRIEGTFSFTKVDQDGVALEGATFTLVDANQQPVTATANTAAGVYTYENLLPGTYTLTETAAPAGYALPANTTWTVTVSETGEVTVTGEGFDTANNTITNTRIEGTFSFTKVDQDGVALEGATFTLVDANQQPVTATANTAAGMYTYENLLPGTYMLTETAAPAGYALPANTSWTVTVSETGEVTVTGEGFDAENNTITNTRIEGTFSFMKVDQDGVALEGATFTLMDATQQPVTATANTAAGAYTYENLLPGTYTLTETAAPAGYALPANTTWTVTVSETGEVTVTGEGFNTANNTIANTRIEGTFSFTKVDQDGVALEGATFTLVDANQQVITATANTAAGVFTYENLLPGTYTLTETAAPAGYALPANTTWMVTVSETGEVTVTGEGFDTANNTITNTRIEGTFSFTKVDQDGVALEGATFALVDANQQPVAATANTAAGVYTYENLLPGTYTLTETAAPAGYALPANTTWTVTVSETGEVTVTGEGFDTANNTITNTRIEGTFSFTKVDQDGVALEGATFTLVDANQQPVTATANTAAGMYTYENLLPGTYMLTETAAPAGYALPANTTWTVTVSETGEVTVTGEDFDTANNTITNTLITGDFTFTKVDQDGAALEGATFTLVDATQQPVTATANTAAGVYTYENLLPGNYTLTETAAPAGYALPANTTWTVTVSETGEVTVTGEDFNTEANTITNTIITGDLTFTKVDETNTPLDGATFTLVNTDTQQEIPAAANTGIGIFTYENLLPGTYTLTETAAPAGYALPSNTTWTVTVSETGEITVTGEDFNTEANTITNTLITGNFTFTKVDETNTPLDGATFVLVNTATQQEIPVSEDAEATGIGIFTYENLLPGTYTLTETAAPAGYALPANTTWTVTVSETGEVTVTGEDFNTEANTITNTLITGDLTFTKVDEAGAPLDGAVFTLTDNLTQEITPAVSTVGGVFTYEKLLPGTYTLTETQAPAGYHLPDPNSWQVAVAANGTVTVTGEGFDTENNTITNILITGDFTFTKVDETGEPLDGAAFTLVDANQQPVTATATTGIGIFTYEKLLPGTYTLTETAAPAGYALPANTTWTVTVSETGEVSVTGEDFNTENNTITNTLITGSFTFTKVGESGEALDGATFTLVNTATQQEIPAAAGNTAGAAPGVYAYENLLPGTYTLTETAAPEGYVLPENAQWTVVVDAAGNVTITGEGYDADTESIANTRIRVGFSFTKVNGAKQPLAGASFTLTDADGISVTAVSQADGSVSFENLLPGAYRMTETAAPVGYLQSQTVWTVIVSVDGTVSISGEGFDSRDLTLVNQPVLYSFSFTKVDAADRNWPLAGARFSLTGTGYKQVVTSDKNGSVTFTGLAAGTYTLYEEAAPKSYRRGTYFKWTVTVHPDGIIDVGSKHNVGSTLLITNTRDESIPQTGAVTWPYLTMLGLGLVMFLAGLITVSRSRQDRRRRHER